MGELLSPKRDKPYWWQYAQEGETKQSKKRVKPNRMVSSKLMGKVFFVCWFLRFSPALTTTVLGAKYIDELFVSLEKARNKNKVSGLSCSSGG